mmetsp:Transcript_4918/g.12262  ORF Transcript_4918/g.12262 Transcript_4918/m.12262 type:complete len:238 (+) Transcript_4918:2303-3016(+)
MVVGGQQQRKQKRKPRVTCAHNHYPRVDRQFRRRQPRSCKQGETILQRPLHHLLATLRLHRLRRWLHGKGGERGGPFPRAACASAPAHEQAWRISWRHLRHFPYYRRQRQQVPGRIRRFLEGLPLQARFFFSRCFRFQLSLSLLLLLQFCQLLLRQPRSQDPRSSQRRVRPVRVAAPRERRHVLAGLSPTRQGRRAIPAGGRLGARREEYSRRAVHELGPPTLRRESGFVQEHRRAP